MMKKIRTMDKNYKIKKNNSFFFLGFFLLFFIFAYASPVYADNRTFIVSDILDALLGVTKLIPGLSLAFIHFILDPESIESVFNSNGLYAFWSFVRDLLNIFFVMMMLFSAFATIFQIEKYNYKKIFIKLIIAALLVNFSWPISRILIDLSNILLYSFLNLISGTIGYSGVFVKDAIKLFLFGGFGEVIAPKAPDINASTEIIAIISLFLIGISLFAMGLLLLVRIFVLVILIIFSPIAFIGPAIPGGSKFSDMWWNNLIKYSFFAPIMLLFFYIALQFMELLRNAQGKMVKATGEQFSTGDPTYLSSVVFSIIPPFIIWIGIGVSMQMGVYGADATMGRAKKVGNWFGSMPKSAWGGTGIPGAWKQNVDYLKKKGVGIGKFRVGGSEQKEKMEAFVAGKAFRVPGSKDYKERKEKEKMEEYKKKGEKELQKLAAKGDRAAILRLTEDGKIDNTTYAAYKKATKHKADDELDKKVKVKNVNAIIKYQTSRGVPPATAYKNNLDDMDADTLLKQKDLLVDAGFHTHYLSTVAATDPKRIRKLAERTSQKVRDDWRARRYKI